MLEVDRLAQLVCAAVDRIGPHVRKTYLEHSRVFSQLFGANVYFKCENLQHTGSFKLRGAMNRFLSLPREQRNAGVVAASTGNHGKAVAFTARKFEANATVFVPENADPNKVAAIRNLGAMVQVAGDDCIQAEASAREFVATNGAIYVSPYNDLEVIAGQGTIGFELCQQLEQVDAVFASMGGGGLVSGIAGYVKSKFPGCQIMGCSPENSNVMMESLAAGELLDLPSEDTISDGTAGGVEPGAITFELCQKLVDRAVAVSESEIRDHLRLFMDTQGMLIEGAAAVAFAGFSKIKEAFQGKNVVIVLCGGNIGVEKLCEVVQGSQPSDAG